jgi:hypothetical protein
MVEPGVVSFLRVAGVLRRPAWTATHPDGTACVCVELEQPGGHGLPLRAEHRLGQGFTAQHVAANACAHMRTGTRVTVTAERIALATMQREPRLQLLDVRGIEYPLPRPRHEPEEAKQS